MDFKELYLSFTHNSHTHMLEGLQVGSPEIISSHRMEKLLKNGHSSVMAQFNSIQVLKDLTSDIYLEMKIVLTNI